MREQSSSLCAWARCDHFWRWLKTRYLALPNRLWGAYIETRANTKYNGQLQGWAVFCIVRVSIHMIAVAGLRAATADYQPLTSGHRILYESYLTRPQPSPDPRSCMAEPWRNHGKCSHIVPAPPMTSRLHPGHFLVAFYIGSFSRGDEQTFTSCIVAALL